MKAISFESKPMNKVSNDNKYRILLLLLIYVMKKRALNKMEKQASRSPLLKIALTTSLVIGCIENMNAANVANDMSFVKDLSRKNNSNALK